MVQKPTYEQLVRLLWGIDEARFNHPDRPSVAEVFNAHPDIVSWLFYVYPKLNPPNEENQSHD